MVIQMPQTLKFDGACSLGGFPGNCVVDSNNLVTLTDMTTEDLRKGTLIKLVIQSASNPDGARPAGPYSVATQAPLEGNFYTVDETKSATSFFARPGFINSDVTAANVVTYDKETSYYFDCNTEHDVPKDGFVVI